MTLGIAWVRCVGSVQELIVISDSRLSGGQFWDANPKIMTLPRTDCVLSFAGDTNDAYPLMLQAYNAIKMYAPAQNRALDISDLKGHLVRVMNHSRSFISNLPKGKTVPEAPQALFMLAGYSWKSKRFKVWILHYDQSIKKFTFRPGKAWGGQELNAYKLVCYVGDEEVVKMAKSNLVSLLRKNNKLTKGSLDMEPFEVLRDMLRANSFPRIGGSIQMVKIYEHANVAPMGVYWPDKSSNNISLLGRPLMEYEVPPGGVIDPDTPTRAYPVK